MDYYGSRDFDALPSMLGHIYERRDSLLRPGLSLTLLPDGKVRGIVSRPEHAGRDFYELRSRNVAVDLSATVPLDGDPEHAGKIFNSVSAHLPFGFRAARSPSTRSAVIPVLGPDPPPGASPSPRVAGTIPEMRPMKFSVPRHGFDQYDAQTFVEGVVPAVLSHDNDVCVQELSRFCFHKEYYVHRAGQTLENLRRFVAGLNKAYTSFMKLDTVFVGIGVFSSLVSEGLPATAAEATPDVVEYGGLRILGHERIPADSIYVMSHTHGSIFVNGPTTLTCTEDEFVVGRYCQVASPQGGLSGRTPYGIRVDVKAEWDTS